MTKRKFRYISSFFIDRFFLITTIMLSLNIVSANATNKDTTFSPYVDQSGNINLPVDFRVTMSHLGSWFMPEGEASGFHDVYTEPSVVLHYRQHGTFPDGATIVKELRKADSGDYTTGKAVRYATAEVKQWFVMIKDTHGRFPKNPSWGDGWGWALFKTDDSTKNASNNYKQDCIACHLPAKETDWIYVKEYPTLLKR